MLLGTRIDIRGRMLQGTALRKHSFSPAKHKDHLRQGSAEAFYLQKASYNSKTIAKHDIVGTCSPLSRSFKAIVHLL